MRSRSSSEIYRFHTSRSADARQVLRSRTSTPNPRLKGRKVERWEAQPRGVIRIRFVFERIDPRASYRSNHNKTAFRVRVPLRGEHLFSFVEEGLETGEAGT